MGADAVKKAPENSKILHGTKMIDAGQKEVIEFTAPTKPGDYEFVCTFPGHWTVMNGVMKVTEQYEDLSIVKTSRIFINARGFLCKRLLIESLATIC